MVPPGGGVEIEFTLTIRPCLIKLKFALQLGSISTVLQIVLSQPAAVKIVRHVWKVPR